VVTCQVACNGAVGAGLAALARLKAAGKAEMTTLLKKGSVTSLDEIKELSEQNELDCVLIVRDARGTLFCCDCA